MILSVSQAFAPLYSQVFTLLSVSTANDANILSVSNVIDVGMVSLSSDILSVSNVINVGMLSLSNEISGSATPPPSFKPNKEILHRVLQFTFLLVFYRQMRKFSHASLSLVAKFKALLKR